MKGIGTEMMATLNTMNFVKLKQSLSQEDNSYNTLFGVFKYLIVLTK